MNRNSASESIKQRLVFVGSEEGKLIALRQSFAEVCFLLVVDTFFQQLNICYTIPYFSSLGDDYFHLEKLILPILVSLGMT